MKNEAKLWIYPIQIMCALLLTFSTVSLSIAQNHPKSQNPEKIDSAEIKSTYVFAGLGAFIPTGQSYSINYSTSIAGLPMELNGGLMFPVSNDILVPLEVRYVRRVANFVDGAAISVFSIEPGARFYLERQRFKDLRLFGAVSGLLAQASVSGNYYVSQNGTITGTAVAKQSYLDVGLGLDIGFSYPLTAISALDGGVHVAIYFASPVSSGGLGNIGGISLCADYRFGF